MVFSQTEQNFTVKFDSGSGGGQDGFSPIVDVATIDGGHRVTITDRQGAESFDVMDGETPEKGVDYWTDEDKAEIAEQTQAQIDETTESISEQVNQNKAYILALGEKIDSLTLGLHIDGLFYIFLDGDPIGNGISLPEAYGDIYGNVDSENNIVLNGDLADGEYFIKYEMADGNTIDIGELLLDTAEPEPVYTNFFVIGGDGYVESGRCSSTGENRTDATSSFVTNYIDVEYGDTVYIKGYQTPTSSKPYSGVKYADGTTGGFILETDTTTIKDFSLADGIAQFTINAANADYVRFTIHKPTSLDDIIINIKRNGEWL